MIEPIGKQQKALVVERSEACLHQAEVIFTRKFPAIEVVFDLSGRSAGMFKVDRGHCQLRYNPWIFAKYFDDNLAATVPHEVAHYLVHQLYGRRRTRPHGKEWRAVMAALGADDSVTGNYDLSGIPQRRQRRFSYRCGCRDHALSTRRHNNALRGDNRYLCRHCKTELEFAGHAANP
jgi:SprT protein